jgi:hypothetical protein
LDDCHFEGCIKILKIKNKKIPFKKIIKKKIPEILKLSKTNEIKRMDC